MKSSYSASFWKTRYDMKPHPEEGWFKEIYRSRMELNVLWAEKRNASTAIVYLLANCNRSVLSACTVSPGFYFDGFEMADSIELMEKYPQHKLLTKAFYR